MSHIFSYAVYVPDELNATIVLLPDVVTVGLPVVVPEYSPVFIERITTPEPPAAPGLFGGADG
jgi:hypothetical protein